MTSNVIDQPAKAGEDSLNMRAYADALTEFIANAQSPLTIALQGEWGSGKTSLMNALRQSLAATDEKGIPQADAPYLGVWINTWQYALMSDPQEAIQKILMGIIGQIPEEEVPNKPKRKRSIAKVCLSFGKVIAISAGNLAGAAIGAGQMGSEINKAYDASKSQPEEPQIDAESPIEKLKRQLKALVADCCTANSVADVKSGKKCGILVFIDDLDRIDPPLAVQILEFLKNIFDIPKCIFVLAIDYGVVVKGLKPKFGEMNAENEREFRSFFDKIIQLPFSMPVASYNIDDFLMDSLRRIGYVDEKERKDKEICEAITFYARQSVGTNPRSLKRLVNYLSLIRILIGKTETTEDDEDFENWKDVLFALVCIQVQYQKIYDALQGEDDSDFTAWGETFEQKWRIDPLEDGEKARLEKMDEFNEKWEQMLYRFCRRDKFLADHALFISRILNRVKARITDAGQPVGETVQWLLRLSAVTNVKSEQTQVAVPENFNKSNYLKDLRWHALKMREVTLKKGRLWDAALSDVGCIYSWQKRVQTNLECSMWLRRKSVREECGDYITAPMFHIFHDGKSFQLKMWGEFWGAWPKEKYKGIDFTADAIQADLATAEAAIGKAFDVFGKTVNCGHHPQDIWWNVTIPFSSHEELVSEEFSLNLCGSLARLAESFALLLPYRIPVNNNK